MDKYGPRIKIRKLQQTERTAWVLCPMHTQLVVMAVVFLPEYLVMAPCRRKRLVSVNLIDLFDTQSTKPEQL
ncbi:hypothetical protein EJ06DRAFT_528719 [Trichodelitschia bisporula]|uniref:Uncharacterized protein n=1 Tax=Trichodelitschia bisporula TaxID=703511 RepID=A0A6G1I3H3_9PEZI|nr:hypothetical protein EJ06DRAFT_528719 [Trichodelitschia bisporula]